ncbi:hypothetical protein PHYBOEH_010807 [Phytophthora boehmeriae]|uniref:Uncharacterized protein n=1 Tax=Phytophthora boehmeriae TaxID=109152 RepID=A0A8T1VKU4_9STRA|nr:hypothetical protein PHYBOEH_010807 [Phytophthora boehmeriae]
METTSSVLRFALATYFMKRAALPSVHAVDTESFPSPSSSSSDFSDEDEEQLDYSAIENGEEDHAFSDVVQAHVFNLSQLLTEQRSQEYTQGIADLREYTASNGLLPSLVSVLSNMLDQEELEAESIAQVIEHMCFETSGEPATVFDELVELVFAALQHCCENKKVNVAIWLLRALDGAVHGLRQHQEHFYGSEGLYKTLSIESASSKVQELICSCLAKTDEPDSPSVAK